MSMDSCRICGSSEARLVLEKNGSQYVKCGVCGVERMAKYPTDAESAAYYQSGYMDPRENSPLNHTHIHFSDGYRAAYYAEKDLTFKDLGAPASSYAGKKLLDVGCANGQFIEYMKRNGVEGEGIDVSGEMVNVARSKGLDCKVKDLCDVQGSYGLITLWDVIEHMPEPVKALEKAASLMPSGGELMIQTPCTGMVSELFGDKWIYYIPIEHIHLFSQDGLFKLLSNKGFSIVSWVRFGSCNPIGTIPEVNKRAIDTIVKRIGAGDTIVLRARKN